MIETTPTTRADLLTHMREARQSFLALLASIPEERMYEIALYDNWTIKDFLAHIGWWEQSTADRIASLRRGEFATPPIGTTEINADVLAKYRETPLNEVRVMESMGFTALETQIEELSEDEIFTAGRFEATERAPLLDWIADNTYAHYEEHVGDVTLWMQKNGLE
jgi:hypothetical protein